MVYMWLSYGSVELTLNSLDYSHTLCYIIQFPVLHSKINYVARYMGVFLKFHYTDIELQCADL